MLCLLGLLVEVDLLRGLCEYHLVYWEGDVLIPINFVRSIFVTISGTWHRVSLAISIGCGT